MNKNISILIFFAFLPPTILGNDVIDITRKIKGSSRRCSNTPIDVRLHNSSTLLETSAEGERTAFKSMKGLVEVLLPHPTFVCFPNSNEEYEHAYSFSHAVCRELGFMTVNSMKGKELRYPTYGLKISSFNCFAQNISTSYCKWKEEIIEYCRKVTAISCGACAGVFKGFRGMIKTSGFPFVSFADVTCEWRVIVPEHHSILLSFNHFEALEAEIPDLMCGVHKPFIEIMYGIQHEVTVKRYCQLSKVKNLSIPFNTVTIRVFTGLSSHHEKTLQNRKKGIAVTYEAIPFEADPHVDPLKMILLTLLGLVFIACIVFCHYIEKHKLCNCVAKSRIPVEVEKTEEQPAFCDEKTEKQILGQRVHFGSEEKSEKGFYEKIPGNDCEKGIKRLQSLLEIPKEYLQVTSHDSTTKLAEKPSLRRDMNHSTNLSESPNRLAVPTGISY